MKKAISRKNILESIPFWLRCAVGTLLKPLPIDWLLGRTFRRERGRIGDTEWLPKADVQRIQLQFVRRLVCLAYSKSVFYRRALSEVGLDPDDVDSLQRFKQVPTIDQNAVKNHHSDMCTKHITAADVDQVFTSGTSTSPLSFYANASRSAIEYAYLTASWERAGYRLGMQMAVLRGRVVRADRKGLYHEYDPILRHHYYSSFHMSDENMARYVEHIARIGPCFLHVYPSTVTALARFLIRSQIKAPSNIQGIIAESEIVYPEQRKMVQEVFGCRLFSCYGQSEKVVLACGCEHSDDYHVWPTYGYFELLDEDGQPVTEPGRRGEIVGTGFINTVMPFIRYRTGDWATYVGERCEACGREHTIIRDIRGHRTQEMLIAADGSEIPWAAVNMHDDTFARVRQFQFMQETPGKAVLKIVPGAGYGEEDERCIRRNLGQKFDGQLSFEIETVDSIPHTARGKAIYVDQRIKREGAEGQGFGN